MTQTKASQRFITCVTRLVVLASQSFIMYKTSPILGSFPVTFSLPSCLSCNARETLDCVCGTMTSSIWLAVSAGSQSEAEDASSEPADRWTTSLGRSLSSPWQSCQLQQSQSEPAWTQEESLLQIAEYELYPSGFASASCQSEAVPVRYLDLG
jgi:hypothetical protein